MHEISIAQGILDTVKEEAKKQGVKKVTKIGLEMGRFSTIEPSSLSFCFDMVKKDSLAEDAVLDIKKALSDNDMKVTYMEGE